MNKRQIDVLASIIIVAVIFFTLGWIGHTDMCLEVAQAGQNVEQCR